jgi:hypothetical protein
MEITTEKRASLDQSIAKNISEFGCHIYAISDPDEAEPSFSYSIGVQDTCGAPEAIVMGLTTNLSGFMINEYNRRVKAGERFKRGTLYSGFIEGFSVYIEPADRKLLVEYMLGCDRYYKDKEYAVVQIVWPATSGVWPWQAMASEWLKKYQPMLGRARPDQS